MVETSFFISVGSVFVEFLFYKKNLNKKDFLNFRLTLAVQLVGTCRKSLRGRPRSSENNALRLDSTQNYLPECVSYKRDCVVCSKVRLKKGLL